MAKESLEEKATEEIPTDLKEAKDLTEETATEEIQIESLVKEAKDLIEETIETKTEAKDLQDRLQEETKLLQLK